jgi:AraC-like DNA-binding protein
VTAVALTVGYSSVSAFIEAFRKHFGRTPARFFEK